MNRDQIIAALREERDRLDWAIAMLENGTGAKTKTLSTGGGAAQPSLVTKVKTKGRRKMSAAAKARIGAATKARWAKFRKEKAKAAAAAAKK